jgi:hypothetical protein
MLERMKEEVLQEDIDAENVRDTSPNAPQGRSQRGTINLHSIPVGINRKSKRKP